LTLRYYYEQLSRLSLKQIIVIDLLALYFTEAELKELLDNLIAEKILEEEPIEEIEEEPEQPEVP